MYGAARASYANRVAKVTLHFLISCYVARENEALTCARTLSQGARHEEVVSEKKTRVVVRWNTRDRRHRLRSGCELRGDSARSRRDGSSREPTGRARQCAFITAARV